MRTSPAELAPDAFRAAGHELVDQIADFLASLPERGVTRHSTPADMRALLGAPGRLPPSGADARAVLGDISKILFENSLLNGHPRFFGYITSSAAPIGALADLLAAAVNPNCGAWALSPVATEVEREVVRWIAELIGVSPESGGILVSGGNMANMVCLMAALRAVAGFDVRTKGVSGGERLTVYASSEVHTWLQKGVDLCGLGTDAMRAIDLDANGVIDVSALARQIDKDVADGCKPAFVVGTAGSVSTGAIDPLHDIAALCAERKIWFHADGAYGAPAAVLDDAPHELRAMALADSVAVDPHKWLYAPLEAGCALVKDPERLHQAFSFHPVYYRFEGAAEDPPTNFHEWGPQNSRGGRAIKVWATMKQVGRDGYVRMIGDDIAISREMYRLASAEPELEPLTQSLSIATYRYVPAELRGRVDEPDVQSYLNDLNSALLERLQHGGEVYLSNAMVGGRFALRACVVNFRTTLEDAGILIRASVREGRALHAERRVASSV